PPSDSLTHPVTEADAGYETALAPIHDVQILARADGEIMSVEVEEGSRVSADRVLARIEDGERRAALDLRQAEADRAESTWKRIDRLHQQQVITEEQNVAARAERQIAAARREQAVIDLERCVVRTPIAGVVVLRRVQKGQVVKAGDLLFEVG